MHDFSLFLSLGLGVMALLVAGVFQAFSDFVMAGLKRAEPSAGAEAMQHINRTVFRSVFLVCLLALAPLSAGAAIYAALSLSGGSQLLLIGAAIVYVPGVFLVTIAANVPRNERLDKLDHASAEAQAYWPIYAHEWTRWNHIRTFGSAVTGIIYIAAALQLAGMN